MNLDTFYQEECRKAVRQVESKLSECNYKVEEYRPCADDAQKLRNESLWYKQFLIKINIDTLKKEIDFILAIPKGFPYKFPKIYLRHENKECKYLPHIDKNLFVCTFDSNEAQPNPEDPEGVALAVINRAKKILEEGLLGENVADYKDEFLAYWDAEPDNQIISLIEPTIETKLICVIDIILS